MAAKGEISWKRDTEDGTRVQVYARRVGDRWNFFVREKRYDQWQAVPKPPLEDWLHLLDNVRRRVGRRLLRPEEVARVQKIIREHFPKAELD